MEEEYVIPKEIMDLAQGLVSTYKTLYKLVKPDVLYIIHRNVKNVKYIEETLDRLSEIPTDEAYELFILLCEYYATIDKEGAKFYLDSYEELYGEEEPKEKKKTIS